MSVEAYFIVEESFYTGGHNWVPLTDLDDEVERHSTIEDALRVRDLYRKELLPYLRVVSKVVHTKVIDEVTLDVHREQQTHA